MHSLDLRWLKAAGHRQMVFQKCLNDRRSLISSKTKRSNMDLTPNHLAQLLDKLGKNLVRDAIHPVLGITLAQWLLDDESGVVDCLATGAVALLMILSAATISFGCAKVVSVIGRKE